MDHKEIAIRLDEADIRIESMIYLAGERLHSRGTEALQRFVEDVDADKIEEIFNGKLVFDDEHVEPEDFLDAISDEGTLGFLVCFASPVRHYTKSKTSWTSAWNHYRTGWVYGETLEEAIERGEAWAEQMVRLDEAKAA